MIAAFAVFVVGVLLFFILPAAEIMTRTTGATPVDYAVVAERGDLRRRM